MREPAGGQGPSRFSRMMAAGRRTVSHLTGRARALPAGVKTAIAVFLAINVAMAAAYVWSRGGQTTTVRVEARGDEFNAYVDGKLHATASFDAPGEGGIVLTFGDDQDLPSLPGPRGIDHIKVTELDSGDVLFEDGFSGGPSPAWEILRGSFSEDGGVLKVDNIGVLSLAEEGWRDYAVELRVKNAMGASIMVRAADQQTGVRYGFRPLRHYDNGLVLLEGDEAVSAVAGPGIELERSETARSIAAMVLRVYPFVLMALAAGFVAVSVIQLADPVLRRVPVPSLSERWAWVAAAGLAAFALGVTLYIAYAVNGQMPHVPDEVAYIFQAKLLAGGHLTASPPPVEEVFDYFNPRFIVVVDGKWSGVYTFGHPLMLALGARIGAMPAIPPLLGAGTVVLTFAIGRRLYDAKTGLLAAALLAVSPFFLMTASNLMSHNTAAFWLMASLFFLVFAEKRPLVYGVLAGLSFGLLFNTRPLEALALAPVFGLLLIGRMRHREQRVEMARSAAGFLFAGLFMLGAYLLHNLGTTGNAFQTALQASTDVGQNLGFGGRHSLSLGIQNVETQMSTLLLVLNGWPQYVGLAFVLLPFILATRSRWDWFLLGCSASVPGAYLFFIGNGIMHGPRYWYPAAPLLMLLAARGADHAARALEAGAGWVRRAVTGAAPRPTMAGYALVYAVVAALIGASVYGWMLGRHTGWNDLLVPNRIVALEGFNGADQRLIEAVDDASLENALVLVDDCFIWQCYGTVFWMNSPSLDGNVVFARSLPRRQQELLAAYPDRSVYVASYADGSLAPFRLDNEPDGRPSGEAPLAREIAQPMPTPTEAPTPSPAEISRRDAQRRDDLAQIAQALQEYHAVHGAYPLAAGLQSLCVYRGLDAGCAVERFLDPLPVDPLPERAYLYLSDGTAFTLFALLEGEAADCGAPLPDSLVEAGAVFCLEGAPPG